MLSIYISCAFQDRDSARQLAESLEAVGHDRWTVSGEWRKDIRAGATWRSEPRRMIEAADAFIVILSESSVRSEGVLLEVDTAHLEDKVLVPVVISDFRDDDLPTMLWHRVQVDLSGWDGNLRDDRFGCLVDALSRLDQP